MQSEISSSQRMYLVLIVQIEIVHIRIHLYKILAKKEGTKFREAKPLFVKEFVEEE
jgi:hypothetical protein